MAEASHDRSAVEPRNPTSRRAAIPRHNRSPLYPPAISGPTTPKSSQQQQQHDNVQMRRAQSQEPSPSQGGSGPRGGESFQGGRAQNSRRGRWRGKGSQRGPAASASSEACVEPTPPRSATESAVVAETSAGRRRLKEAQSGSASVPDEQVQIASVLTQSSSVETFVGRWREKADGRGRGRELQRGPEVAAASYRRAGPARKKTESAIGETFVGRWREIVPAVVIPAQQKATPSAAPSVAKNHARTSSRRTRTGSAVAEMVADVEQKEGQVAREWALSNGGSDGKAVAPQQSARVSYGGQWESRESGHGSPSASSVQKSAAGVELQRDRNGWGESSETVATASASGWDDFETPETQSSERWNVKDFTYDPLNASDFDCCDTHIEVLGQKVLVTVAATAATIEKWLSEHQGERRFGFDIEWRPTFQKGDYHDTAILQLSVEKRCLLVQLLFVDRFPEPLKSLLADPNVTLGGVGIKADVTKLKNDHGLVCKGELELGDLAAQVYNDKSLRKAGIVTLTQKVLGTAHKKNRKATMSNWEIRDLTYDQIKYGATDAWLSYSLLVTLCALKENPPPPKPAEPAKPSLPASATTPVAVASPQLVVPSLVAP